MTLDVVESLGCGKGAACGLPAAKEPVSERRDSAARESVVMRPVGSCLAAVAGWFAFGWAEVDIFGAWLNWYCMS